MKMKRALNKFNPRDSHVSVNLKSPDLDDKRIRLERRWRRREIMVDSLKHRRVASATNTASNISGSTDVLVDKNDHAMDDEVDEEWKAFLAMYTSDNDEEMDEDYSLFWATFSNVDVNFSNNNVSEEIEESYNCFSNLFVSDSISDGVDVDEDDQLLRKSFSVGQHSLASAQEFDTPEVQSVVDEDYEQFLNSGWVVDGDFVYGCDENTENTSNVEGESNSSDSDLVVLESYPNCENTPFVSSKAYDSSCFVDEMHPKDNTQTTSFHRSQFRKRLMEYLDRSYDYEEYKSLLVAAYEGKEGERHLETRQGVIKSYHSVGVTKSYLQVHPDLAKAIAMESKEKPRVLFLLRGFFFWLEEMCPLFGALFHNSALNDFVSKTGEYNLSHEGQFQPWCDESCLEIMQKM